MAAWRAVVRRPAFFVPCVAGLAIGIAASSAVFSVFSAIELDPMGFRDTGRLAAVWLTDPAHGQDQVELSFADWQAWRSGRTGTADGALASSVNLDFTIYAGAQPEHVDGTTVTGNFFAVLGATPLAGRFLTEDDDQPGAPVRVVLAYKLWRSKFGGDHSAIGRQIRLGSGTATVIGVTRPEFDFPHDVELWTALRPSWPGVEQNANLGVFRSIARLAPGVSPPMARERPNAAPRPAAPQS